MSENLILKLKHFLTYSPETGELRHKITRGRVKAGDLAGSISNGRINIKLDGALYQGNRIAYAILTGEMPKPSDIVVCVDGDYTNLKAYNLVKMSKQDLMQSELPSARREKWSSKCNSPRGVRLTKAGTYQAALRTCRNYYYLGTFKTLTDATSALYNKRLELNQEPQQ